LIKVEEEEEEVEVEVEGILTLIIFC